MRVLHVKYANYALYTGATGSYHQTVHVNLELDDDQSDAALRAAWGIPPLPLTAAQVVALTHDLGGRLSPTTPDLVESLAQRVSPGVDDAARVKARFLAEVAKRQVDCPALSAGRAVALLGTMRGGYNVGPLVDLLDDADLGSAAAEQLAGTLLVFDSLQDVAAKARRGNRPALRVLQSWAGAEWLSGTPPVAEELHLTAFRVEGEVNTDDLSPAPHAWSRADIPRHALAFLQNRPDAGDAVAIIRRLKELGRPVAFVADVIGTGSSRKSAVNSLLWHIGDDIPYVPNKRRGGVVLGTRIAPIFFNTLEDSGALPIECDVDGLATGDHFVLRVRAGRVETPAGGLIAGFTLRSDRLLDEVRAGGRLQLLLGRALGQKARHALTESPAQPATGLRAEPAAAPRERVSRRPPPSWLDPWPPPAPPTPWLRRSWAGRAGPMVFPRARTASRSSPPSPARTPPDR